MKQYENEFVEFTLPHKNVKPTVWMMKASIKILITSKENVFCLFFEMIIKLCEEYTIYKNNFDTILFRYSLKKRQNECFSVFI